MSILLSLNDLRLETTQGRVLLDSVSISIPEASVVSLVGESGSGKSLTALSILGLQPSGILPVQGEYAYRYTDGSILRWGPSVGGSPATLRGKEIGMVFQEPMSALNPLLTCGDQLLETIQSHTKLAPKMAKELAITWLERVRLPDPQRIYHSYPHQISGGQKQRVCIAMALCTQPRLLVADEPTTALDVQVQHSILDLFIELQAQLGLSLLFISHDLKLVGRLGGHTAVLRNGVMQEFGETKSLLSHPSAAYTQALLECRPKLYPKMDRLPTVTDFELGLPPKSYARTKDAELARTVNLSQQPILTQLKEIEVKYSLPKAFYELSSKKFTALHSTSLGVRRGEALGIVGESGSGKTTLIRTWMGLQQCQGGEGYWQEHPLGLRRRGSFPKKLREKMQIVYQDPASALNPRMTVFQTLAEPLLQHKKVKTSTHCSQKVAQLLKDVGLNENYADRLTTELSGGQKQRLCIARALCLEPQVLVLDEAVSALDVSVQAQILNLLNDLKAEKGLSYIFVTHDLAVVGQLCDTLAVLQNGRLVEVGPTQDLLQKPKHAYTQQLIRLASA